MFPDHGQSRMVYRVYLLTLSPFFFLHVCISQKPRNAYGSSTGATCKEYCHDYRFAGSHDPFNDAGLLTVSR